MPHPKEERTLVILKPDCVQRGLLGEIIHRFENKGLKIIGMKMTHLTDDLLNGHYAPHKDKPFFDGLKKFMSSSPVVVMVIAGIRAVESVRTIVGPTKGYTAPSGTIRGDFSMSGGMTVVHASDSVEAGVSESERLFSKNEIFDYKRADFLHVYSEEDLA